MKTLSLSAPSRHGEIINSTPTRSHRTKRASSFALLSAFTVFLASGCGREAAPPVPIAVEEAPGKLAEAVSQEQNPEVKKLLDEAADVMRRKDYGQGLLLLQALSGRSDLTPEHRDLVSRLLLAANKALTDQASSGDQRAQEILQFRRATK